VLDPGEELSVVRFRDLARRAVAGVHERGAVALLVGGSGLYWRAVVDGLRFPPTDPTVRADIEARAAQDPDAAHEELRRQDPAAAAMIPVRNVRRVVRALEVIALTGETFSSFDDAWGSYRSVYGDLTVAYLEPSAEVLRARIDARARDMVADGLLAEAAAVLTGELAEAGLAQRVADRTWRYARRQRSWFRADPRCSTVTTPDEVLARWT